MLSYYSVADLVERAEKAGKKISDIAISDQAPILGMTEEDLVKTMEAMFDVMVEGTHEGTEQDLRSNSGLTGGEGQKVMQYAQKNGGGFCGPFFTKALARGLAVSNCNAAMGKIVATPTAGSCGILPGCLVTMYEDGGVDKNTIVRSIFTAGAFGMVIAENASIAGAEGGCQAECGSASAMAAAALTEIMGGSPKACGDACGMAIVNQLGLVCDPVAGLVEIPCVKRNASGVAVALTAATMALAGVPLYIPVDQCIEAMKRIGDSLPSGLKETAQGGLAITEMGKKLKRQVFGDKN